MSTILFPRKGDRLRAHSVFLQALRVAAAGVGVLSGMVPTRASATSIAVSAGTWRSKTASGSYAGGSLTGIPQASANLHRYDLIVFDTGDSTLKRIAGSENTPTILSDFLENLQPMPPELASADQILLGIILVNSSGIPNTTYGHYATGGVANMNIEIADYLNNARGDARYALLSHSSQHQAGGAYPIKLDDLAAPDDNTDLNVSTSNHGLCPKATNVAGQSLLATGVFGAIKLDDAAAPDDNTDLNASTTKHGLMQKYPNTAQVLKGDGTWLTRVFDIGFPFGDGNIVIQDGRCEWRVPIACKITAARIRESADVSGSITCTLYKRTQSGTWGSALDTFALSSTTSYEETGLNIAVNAGDWLSIRVSSITLVKQIVCSLACEAT